MFIQGLLITATLYTSVWLSTKNALRFNVRVKYYINLALMTFFCSSRAGQLSIVVVTPPLHSWFSSEGEVLEWRTLAAAAYIAVHFQCWTVMQYNSAPNWRCQNVLCMRLLQQGKKSDIHTSPSANSFGALKTRYATNWASIVHQPRPTFRRLIGHADPFIQAHTHTHTHTPASSSYSGSI